MKKILLFLLLAPVAFAQTPARYDMPVMMTTPGQNPLDNLPALLAVTNATVSVCGYPAVLSGGMCTNAITTYTDSTLATACPASAQLTAPGSAACVSTTGLQGAFGFWYDSQAQTHMTYTVKTKWGVFGPYDILPGGGSGTSLTLQHNSTPLTDQSTLNFLDNGTIAPDSGYTLAKFLTNSTGGWAAEVPTTLNSFNGQCPLGIGGLTGAFTDGSGVLKSALCLGDGPTTVAVPSGATQLLLGIDDDTFADNDGSFLISVAVNGGTATQYTILGTAMPWSATTNPSYSYGINDGTAPVVTVTGLTAGEPVTITYVSGTVSVRPGFFPETDANGYQAAITGSTKGSTSTFFPTVYMGAVNSYSVPASALFLGTDSNRQPVAATTANLASFLSGLTGCASAANAYVPADNECEPVGGTAFISSLTTTGTSGAATVTSGVLNIPVYSSGGGGGTVFCTPNAQTGTTYTLVLTDGTASGAACIGTVTMNNATNNTVTIPPNSSVAFPTPDEIDFIQLGAGQTCLAAGVGVTLTTPTSLCARAQNSTIGIRQLSANTWIVFGDTQ